VPGAAARLELRPSRLELRPGTERCFVARVLDASGCPLRSSEARLTLSEGGGTVSGRCFRAPSTEGTARVVAQAGLLRDQATVVVRIGAPIGSDDRDTTSDVGDLVARRQEPSRLEGAGPRTEASSTTGSRVSARPGSGDATWAAAVVAGGIAACALLGVLVVGRRRRRLAGPAKASDDEKTTAPRGRPELSRVDDQEAPGRNASPLDAAALPAEDDMICPTCRRGYPPGATRCSQDATELAPYRTFASAGSGTKRCPACARSYGAQVRFCGEDGATLVDS
jgi:hypothetical protein